MSNIREIWNPARKKDRSLSIRRYENFAVPDSWAHGYKFLHIGYNNTNTLFYTFFIPTFISIAITIKLKRGDDTKVGVFGLPPRRCACGDHRVIHGAKKLPVGPRAAIQKRRTPPVDPKKTVPGFVSWRRGFCPHRLLANCPKKYFCFSIPLYQIKNNFTQKYYIIVK